MSKHEWDKDGERCVKCGAKDWMGGECSASASPAGYATCSNSCEAFAYQIEIRRLKSVLIREAAELAKLLHHDDITDSLDRAIYAQIQRMKSAGFDDA